MEVTLNEREQIRQFIMRRTHVEDLDDHTDLFKAKTVNSLFVIELLIFIEKTFNVKIIISDMDMDNFRSVNNICKFLENKKRQV